MRPHNLVGLLDKQRVEKLMREFETPQPLTFKAAAGDPMAPPPIMPMPTEGYAKFPEGTRVRDIFTGREGVVAPAPAGDHGDIVFVIDDEKGLTYPMRSDQLESIAPAAPVIDPLAPPVDEGKVVGPGAPEAVADPGLPPLADAGAAAGAPVSASKVEAGVGHKYSKTGKVTEAASQEDADKIVKGFPGDPVHEVPEGYLIGTEPPTLVTFPKASVTSGLVAAWEEIDSKDGKTLWIDRSKSKKGTGEFADDDVHPLTTTDGEPPKPNAKAKGWISWDEFKTGSGKSIAWDAVWSPKSVAAGIKGGGVHKGGDHEKATDLDWVEDANGLTFKVNPAYQTELQEAVAAGTSMRALDDVLSALREHGDLETIRPEEIGALTDAPIVGRVERDDQGNITEVSEVYWFPNYAVEDPLATLAEKGEVTFAKAPGNGKGEVATSMKAVLADYTGACAECGKNVGSANITMSGHPGKKFCSDACVNKAYADLTPKGKSDVKKTGQKAWIGAAAPEASKIPGYGKLVATLDKAKTVDLSKVVEFYGGVPVIWDGIVARLREDGYRVKGRLRPEVQASSLLQKGLRPSEIKAKLCGAGMTLAATKALLLTATRILAKPLTKKPEAQPTPGFQWVWVEENKAWEEQPAVAASKIKAEVTQDPMVRQYLETALWSSNDESDPSGGEPFDRNHSIEEIAPDSVAQAEADCKAFKEKAGALLEGYGDDSQIGHDFWLTRNGHGAGFWDRYLDVEDPTERAKMKETGEKLSEISKGFKEINVVLGDDGKIHFE